MKPPSGRLGALLRELRVKGKASAKELADTGLEGYPAAKGKGGYGVRLGVIYGDLLVLEREGWVEQVGEGRGKGWDIHWRVK